ncbi:MAG: hypothetical protein LQ341_006322 [Variospora aurantia]|nr:MAG: hypothetical protein LQ341_006322 [Variospora aurantia]
MAMQTFKVFGRQHWRQLAYRGSIDSFESVMIPRRDHSREVYYPKNDAVFDVEDGHWRKRSRSRRRSHRTNRHRKYVDSSDSDTDSIISSDEERQRSKARKQTLLAACLATVTSIAAGNNIYQSTKAHAARKRQLQNGKLSDYEAAELKRKGRKMDLILLGVAAVCLNNAKNGWRRMEAQQEQARTTGNKYEKERKSREKMMIQA